MKINATLFSVLLVMALVVGVILGAGVMRIGSLRWDYRVSQCTGYPCIYRIDRATGSVYVSIGSFGFVECDPSKQ